ncbi:hypothetical protein BsIDN1_03660 [Bacillus safensis]|uniref:Uncharacterized protein n=1 Tax=Bacillus safensis TaxID=561879 RepID=A0A5S9M243_BACIA|nr:hypothetical protein BsIDN1_03660 [Bacillus safensis]
MIEVFETEEDFEGIHIDYLDPVYEAVRNKFTHPFFYELGIIHSLRALFKFIEKKRAVKRRKHRNLFLSR